MLGYKSFIIKRIKPDTSDLPFNDPEVALRTVEDFSEVKGSVGFTITSARYKPVHHNQYMKLYAALAAIIHKFGVSVDFLRKFRAESVFRCDYKASKLVEPNRDEARAPSGNSSARRGLYICVGAGSQGTVRWDTDGASVMRRAFVRDKTMPGVYVFSENGIFRLPG